MAISLETQPNQVKVLRTRFLDAPPNGGWFSKQPVKTHTIYLFKPFLFYYIYLFIYLFEIYIQF